MNTVKVTVIIPCYNSAQHLDQCLQSVLSQTYRNLEVLIIDDGSTDNTIHIINRHLNDPRVKLLQKSHTGVSASRNLGIEQATGDAILFVDSDDLLHKRCIEILLSIQSTTSSDITIIRQPLKFHGAPPSPITAFETRTETLSGEQAALSMLYYKIVISSWGKLFLRSLIDKHSLTFDSNLQYGEGFNFTIAAMVLSRRVSIVNAPLYFYRVDNAGSVMSNYTNRMYSSSIEALDKIQAKLPDTITFANAIRYARFHTAYDILNNIIGCHAESPQTLKRIKSDLKLYCPSFLDKNISLKDSAKIIAYRFAPILTARTINKSRKRRFVQHPGVQHG